MRRGKILAIIAVALYVLQLFSTATDLSGNLKSPMAIILFSMIADLIYYAIATVVLWKVGHKFVAVALPVTLLARADDLFLTPNPSALNGILNIVRVAALVIYFYAAWLLFVSDER